MINIDHRYEKEQHLKLLNIDYFQNKDLGFKIVENVFAIPKTISGKSGGVYDESGILIEDTSTNLEYGCPSFDVKNLKNVNQEKEIFIYLGVYESCWGHFITDCLQKIWFIKSNNFNKCDSYKFVVISEKTDIGKNHKKLLELLGIDYSKLTIVTKNTFFEKLIIPDSCFYYDNDSIIHYTKEYVSLITIIKDHFKNNHLKEYKKIYYSYSNYKKGNGYKKTFGEEKLELFFKKQGFLIVHPEDHSIDKQLNMLANCEVFASTEGSSSHNSIFVNPDATIIIIPRGPYFSGYQQAIDSLFGNNIYYIDSSLSAFVSKTGPWGGPNYFYVSEELMNYFSIPNNQRQKYRDSNFKDIKKYFSYCLISLSGRHYYVQNIYAEKFMYYLGLNSKKVFPISFLKKKALNLIAKIKRK